MRTKLLVYFITLLGVISANSQATETYQIGWKWNTNGDSANKTIEVGDNKLLMEKNGN